jgi:hypothetical protein
MRILIVGSSGFDKLDAVRHWVRLNLTSKDTVLVTNSNRVEAVALIEAAAMGIRNRVVRPKGGVRSSYTPIETKEQVLKDVDMVVAFYDGKSPGTKSTIALARSMGKPIDIIG